MLHAIMEKSEDISYVEVADMLNFETFTGKLTEICIQIGGKLILAILIFVIGRIVIGYIMKGVGRLHALYSADKTVSTFILSSIKIILNIVLVLSIVSVLGVPMASVITVLASAGMAIGLSMQGALSNIAGGIVLLVFRPYNVGDYILTNGVEGSVRSISIMYTTLITVDNKKVVIPNGELMNKSITNSTCEPFRRVDLQFSTGKGEDIVKVQSAIMDVIKSNSKVLNDTEAHAPFASIDGGTNESMIFTARAWVKTEDYWTVYYELMQGITTKFGEIGISAPAMRWIQK